MFFFPESLRQKRGCALRTGARYTQQMREMEVTMRDRVVLRIGFVERQFKR